ncbi:phage tail tape measure C-terminal domain-containing protein [Limnohabitans sp.]|uniref:phage tail tape measure C-terminal domain-containing protein n=1 Tax=Limnohabitans sp. TaxID=1907725 RepID=UPI0025BA157B|nr:phage tail tape measure C-terminal domain-containing protein [Limnohabitans sp.]
MAERNLSIRLAVIDGGKVKAELADVGEAGERSLKKIESASQPASAGLNLLSKAANDAFVRMEDATSRLGMLGSVLGRLGPAGLIVGASVAAVGYGMHQLVVPVAEVGEELNKLSQKTAVSVEALSALLYASELSDVSAESLTKALKFLSTAMFDAKVKGGEGSAALKAFGVSALDAQGQIRPTEQVLLDLAEKFAAMPDSAEKAALAVKLFGKNGLDMIPMLNQGRDGLTEMMEEAKRLGLVMSADAARAAEEFNDNMKRLHAVNEGVQRQIGSALLPILADLTEQMFLAKTEAGGFTSELQAITHNRQQVLTFLEEVATGLGFIAESAVLAKRVISQPFDSLSVVAKDVETWIKTDLLRSMKSMGYDEGQINAEIAKLQAARDRFVEAANDRLMNLNDNPGYVNRIEKFFDEQRRTVRVMGQRFVLDTAEQAAQVQKIYDEFLPKMPRKRPSGLDLTGFEKNNEGLQFLKQLEQRATRVTQGEGAELRARALELERKGYAGVVKEAEKYIDMIERMEKQKGADKKFEEYEKELQKAHQITENYIGNNRLKQEELQLKRQLLDVGEIERAALQTRFEMEKAAVMALRQAEQINDPGLKAEAIAAINDALARQLPIVEQLARANVEYQRSFDYGLRSSLRTYIEDATNAAKQAERAVTSAFKGMEDAMVQFVTTGKVDFNSLANSIIADLVRIQIQKMITLPLAGWMSGLNLFGGSSGGNGIGGAFPAGATDLMSGGTMVAHTGGLIGSDVLATRSVGLHHFDGAQRFHTGGVVAGEVPIIAQPGEAVFTPGQLRSLGGALAKNNPSPVKVLVNVNNHAPGVDARVQTSQQPDGTTRLDVMVEQIEARMSRSINQGVGIAPTLERRYGLNPAVGALR